MAEVNCPNCQKKIKYSEVNKYRPFCSQRCRLIDLGQWAEEKYKVPCQEDDQEKKISEENFPDSDES